MTQLQMIPICQLQGNKANPRKLKAEKWHDESLKASLAAHGLLQSLLVHPDEGKTDSFTVIAGNRRLRALKSMAAPDYLVPCIVSEKAAQEEAIAENFVRADIHLMDHYKSMSNLMKEGLNTREIAKRFGVDPKYVEKVVALGQLAPRAQKAVKNDEINMQTAQMLTTLPVNEQNKLLDAHMSNDGTCNLEHWDVKRHLNTEKVNVDVAEFKLKKYDGTFSTDLFGGEQWFDDTEQFWRLQNATIKSRVDQWSKSYGLVEETDDLHKFEWVPGSITDPSRIVKLWCLNKQGRFRSTDRYSLKYDQKNPKEKNATDTNGAGTEVISNDTMTKAGRAILNKEIIGALQLKMLEHEQLVLKLLAHCILTKAKNNGDIPLGIDFHVNEYARQLDNIYNPEGPDGPQTAVNSDCREPLGQRPAGWRSASDKDVIDPNEVWSMRNQAVYEFVVEQIVSTMHLTSPDSQLADDSLIRQLASDVKLDFRASWSITKHFLSGIKSKDRLFEIATEMGLTKDHHMGSHIIVEPNDKKGDMIIKIVDAEEQAHLNPEHEHTKWAKYIRAYVPKEASIDPVPVVSATK